MVDAEPLLKNAPKEGEAAGEDRRLVAESPQGADQPLGAVGERNAVDDLLQRPLGQAFQQRHAASERLLEIELAAHRALGDLPNFLAGAGQRGQLVDHLALDQRGVHVERDQPAVAPEDRVVLERDVDFTGLGDGRKRGPDAILVDVDRRRRRRGGELHAKALRRGVAIERRP